MPTKEFLYDEYVIKDRTALDIGQEIDLSDTQVRYWLRKYDIPVKPRGGKRQTVDLTGQEFGKFTVLEQVKGNGLCAVWKCRCKCGNVKDIGAVQLKHCSNKLSCKSCRQYHNWKGCGALSGLYFRTLKNGADKRKLKFDVSIEYLWKLYQKQNKKCAITGIDIYFVRNRTTESKSQSASLDRIDATKGYIKGNVRWVHKMVNIIKWHLSDDEFYFWCKKIVDGPLVNSDFQDLEQTYINRPVSGKKR